MYYVIVLFILNIMTKKVVIANVLTDACPNHIIVDQEKETRELLEPRGTCNIRRTCCKVFCLLN